MENFLEYNRKKIFYRVEGKGKPVFLLHGFGEDGNIWESQVDHLKSKFQLIVPDLPGSGKSELVDDMSIEGMAEVIKAIIDHEKNNSPSLGGGWGEAVVVLGHSMGGYITLALAEKYPGYLKAFGLVHSTAYADNEEKKAVRDKAIDFIHQHGAYQFLKTTLPNLFSKGSQSKIPGKIKELIERGNNFSPDALVNYYQAMKHRPDRTEVLRTTNLPVLFLMGKYDGAAPLDDVLKQCHMPEKSYIHILHQTGHMGMLEETETTNRLLEKFLEEI